MYEPWPLVCREWRFIQGVVEFLQDGRKPLRVTVPGTGKVCQETAPDAGLGDSLDHPSEYGKIEAVDGFVFSE
jgi:hypothetical protein